MRGRGLDGVWQGGMIVCVNVTVTATHATQELPVEVIRFLRQSRLVFSGVGELE